MVDIQIEAQSDIQIEQAADINLTINSVAEPLTPEAIVARLESITVEADKLDASAIKNLDGFGFGDMLKSVYDANNDGIVDKSALCAINFSFSDVSVLPLILVVGGQRILSVRLSIDIAFDDPNASLFVGDSISNARLMSAAQNYPTLAEEFETNPSYVYASPTQVNLYIVAGVSSAGSGVVYLYGG